jgi:hypothetical protein
MNSFVISSYQQVLLGDPYRGSEVVGACGMWSRSTYMVLLWTHEGKEPLGRQE